MVQLGARIGAKIRDRDEQERGSLQRNKVCREKGETISSLTYVHSSNIIPWPLDD